MAPRRSEAGLLAELEAIAAKHRALADELQKIQSRRDFLIVALYRRGSSLRKIAAAAGLHYTRVRQLARAASAVADRAGVRKRVSDRTPKKKK
jgi:hypothetical protein